MGTRCLKSLRSYFVSVVFTFDGGRSPPLPRECSLMHPLIGRWAKGPPFSNTSVCVCVPNITFRANGGHFERHHTLSKFVVVLGWNYRVSLQTDLAAFCFFFKPGDTNCPTPVYHVRVVCGNSQGYPFLSITPLFLLFTKEGHLTVFAT